MKLQLALDTYDLDKCIELLELDHQGVIDIVEAGTPLIIRYGLEVVRTFKERYPQKEILADLKIMDAGEYEATLAFEAGADIVTVLAVANDDTIKGAIKSAKEYHGKVMVDMLEISDLENRAKQLIEMGVDYICVHNGYDIKVGKGMDYLSQLKIVNGIDKTKTVMAGGVNPDNIALIKQEGAAIVVCGDYICNSENPIENANYLKKLILDN